MRKEFEDEIGNVFNKGYMQHYIGDLRYYLGLQDWTSCDAYYNKSARYSDRNTEERKRMIDDRSLYWYVPPYSDGTLATTLEQATQNLAQSILPGGIDSISIDAFTLVKATRRRERNDELSKEATDQLRTYLKRNDQLFNNVFQSVVEDFSLYGNAVAIQVPLEGSTDLFRLEHLPFHETYFGSLDGGVKVTWLYTKKTIQTLTGESTIELKFVFMHQRWVVEKIIDRGTNDETSSTYEYKENFPAVLVAKDGTFCDTLYGWSGGLVALPHVKDLNWASNEYKSAIEKLVVPPVIYDASLKIKSASYGENSLDLSSGGVMALSIPEGMAANAADSVSFVKPSDLDLQALMSLMAERTKQVQSSFFVDPIFNVATAGVVGKATATEVIERKAQSLIMYRGKAIVIENSILTQYIRSIADSLRFRNLKNIVYEVSYLSAEEKRVRKSNQEELANQITFLKNIGVEPDQEDIERFKEEGEAALI